MDHFPFLLLPLLPSSFLSQRRTPRPGNPTAIYLTQAEPFCHAGETKMSKGYGELPARIHMGMW